MNTVPIIEEIIKKECERYELVNGGFISNCEEIILELARSPYASLNENCTSEEFNAWKEKLLAHLYTKKSYVQYYSKNLGSNNLRLLTRQLMRNLVINLHNKYTEKTIDEELFLSKKDTVAFKLSNRLFSDIYPKIFNKTNMIVLPSQLEDQCDTSIQKLFPLDHVLLIERLKRNDNEFWSRITKVVQTLVYYVSFNNKFVNTNKMETIHVISINSITSLLEQIRHNKLNHITSGTHFYNSLKATCRNKLHEYMRARNRQEEEFLDDEEWERINAINPGEEDKAGDFLYLSDLNLHNEYELSCAIVDILSYGEGEMYDKLIGDKADDVKILLLHAYEQMSYEDIAIQLYGKQSLNEHNKACAKLRQTVSRTKKYLKNRMKTMVIELGYQHKSRQ